MVNRNSACPCGSGRRFKRCCGADGESVRDTASPPAATVGSLQQQALSLQSSGQLADAREHYLRALAIEPVNFDALHMLGVIHFQLDDPDSLAHHQPD